MLTAPEPLRAQLYCLGWDARAEKAAHFRPGPLSVPLQGAKAAMVSVARRYLELSAEVARLDADLDELVHESAPGQFLAKQGVGTRVAATLLTTVGDNPGRLHSEAGFAALCGASPVDASSGKQVRHRLNRGGDRQANSALWRIVHTRIIHHDPRTRPTSNGAPKKARHARRSSGV